MSTLHGYDILYLKEVLERRINPNSTGSRRCRL